MLGRGNNLAVELTSQSPKGRGLIPRLGSCRWSLISIEHAELLRSTPLLVLGCAWLVTMALHVHCGLGQLSLLPTSENDKWVAAKHWGRAKRSRISNTHRLRSSLQFRYINNQSLLLLYVYFAWDMSQLMSVCSSVLMYCSYMLACTQLWYANSKLCVSFYLLY